MRIVGIQGDVVIIIWPAAAARPLDRQTRYEQVVYDCSDVCVRQPGVVVVLVVFFFQAYILYLSSI